MATKNFFLNFDLKLARTWPIQEIELRQFTGVIEIYTTPTPVAMATKIWEF